MPETAILTVGDKHYELPILTGTEGERAVDITKLRDQSGLVTFDPSLGNTGVCRSAITFIDGDKGILRYRGIPIEQFTNKPNFVEAAWLLIFGRLPRAEELKRFSGLLTSNELLHEGMKHQFQHIPLNAPPMAILSATLSNLACYHQEFFALESEESLEEAAARLISKVRTIAAFSYRRSLGLPFTYPDPNLRYCANFLHMMFSIPHSQYIVTREVEDALNLIFILHADHEQNCSTSTVRIVGSARANLFASCAAGVCALWGPLHGGANVEVVEMLETNPPRRTKARGMRPRRERQDQSLQALWLRPSGLPSLRSPGENPQGGVRQGLRQDQTARPAAGYCPQTRRTRPDRSLLHRSPSLSQCRFLQRNNPPRHRHSHQHVHRAVRHRPPPRLDRPMEGTARRSEHQDSASPANLHRRRRRRTTCRWRNGDVKHDGRGLSRRVGRGTSPTFSYCQIWPRYLRIDTSLVGLVPRPPLRHLPAASTHRANFSRHVLLVNNGIRR